MGENRLQDALTIAQHFIVPKAKNLPTLALEIGVTNSVAIVFCVLRAVSFDNQLSANAKKVDNVRSDWDLPTKLKAAEATISQQTP